MKARIHAAMTAIKASGTMPALQRVELDADGDVAFKHQLPDLQSGRPHATQQGGGYLALVERTLAVQAAVVISGLYSPSPLTPIELDASAYESALRLAGSPETAPFALSRSVSVLSDAVLLRAHDDATVRLLLHHALRRALLSHYRYWLGDWARIAAVALGPAVATAGIRERNALFERMLGKPPLGEIAGAAGAGAGAGAGDDRI